MAMSGLQYAQTFFNFGSCIIGAIGFTTFLTYLYTTHYSCSNVTSCKLYKTIEADAAFSFALIFLPWIGCIFAFMGKRQITMVFALIMIAITVSILICSAIIISNSDLKDTWRVVRDSNQYVLPAPEVNAMIVYNVSIAQIICIWFFLLGSAILTPLTAKKQVQNQNNQQSLQQQSGKSVNGDPIK